MKSARQARIVELLRSGRIGSQLELADALAADGFAVTQGTLSRDLVDVGAVRMRSSSGELVYVLRGEEPVPTAHRFARLASVLNDVMLSAEASANQVVVRTPPGAAQYLASMIDGAELADVLGTIAGDDTILMIARDPDGGAALVARLRELGGKDEDG